MGLGLSTGRWGGEGIGCGGALTSTTPIVICTSGAGAGVGAGDPGWPMVTFTGFRGTSSDGRRAGRVTPTPLPDGSVANWALSRAAELEASSRSAPVAGFADPG